MSTMAVRKTHEAELPGEPKVPELEDSHDESGGGSDAEEASDDGGDAEEASDDGGDAEEASDDGGDAEEASDDGGDAEEASDDGGDAEGKEEDGGDAEGKEEGGGDAEGKEEGGGDAEGKEEDGGDAEGKEEDGGDAGVGGWADAMAKILGKKSSASGNNILVKNKELEKMKAAEKEEQLKRQKQVDEKRTWEMMFREKADVSKARQTEKALQRIATRGVVQLFNAVRKHQNTVDEAVKEAGGSERKKAKILSSFSKRDFISVLRREDRVGTTSGSTKEGPAAAAEDKPSWSVLRDDFMMGASMKDWDRDSDGPGPGPDSTHSD